MPVAFNEKCLVEMSVMGEISNPVSSSSPYRISADGEALVLPGVGGISYNVKVGDPVCGWKADHVEPGVSIKNPNEKSNNALNVLACIGNRAVVVSGKAWGKAGTVTGKHGGIEHVLVDFDDKILDRLVIGDKVLVRACGVGLELPGAPSVRVMNLSPALVKKVPLEVTPQKELKVPVARVVPARVMGSGLGASQCYRGDYDIQLFDEDTVKEFSLDTLRFGDLVAITDADHTFGRVYRRGAISVGVVVHSQCVTAGHGPGVVTCFTSREGRIQIQKRENANIGFYLKIGRFRRK